MSAFLGQPSAVEYQDAVRIAQRGQAVGDGDGRAAFGQVHECLLDHPLGLRVDVARGFIEHQNRRIVKQRTGQRQTLFFAAGQAGSLFAQRRVVPQRRTQDEVVGARGLGGSQPLLDRGFRLSIRKVVPDRAAKQIGFLKHNADPLPQLRTGVLTHVDSVHQHVSVIHVVEPTEQVDQCRLPRAAAADDADHLARLHFKRNALEHRLVRIVAEMHVVEHDRAAWCARVRRSCRLAHRDWRVEQFQHPLGAGQKTGQPGREIRQRRQGRIEHGQVGQEGNQRTERHRLADHVAASDVPHDQPAETEDDLHPSPIGRGRFLHPQTRRAMILARPLKPAVLA